MKILLISMVIGFSFFYPGVDTEDNLLPVNYDDVLSILQIRNQPEDQQLRIGTLTALERYSEAQTVLSTFSTTVSENLAYSQYMGYILNEGLGVESISEPTFQNMLALLDEDGTSTKGLVENLQYFRDGIYAPFQPEPVEETGNRSSKKPSTLSSISKNNPILIQPNPFSEAVTFDLTKVDFDAVYEIEVLDVTGRKIWQKQVNGGVIIEWKNNTETGTYFYRIISDKALIQKGKLIKL